MVWHEQSGHHRGGTDGTRNPKDTWIGVPFPPLVDDKTWMRVRARKFITERLETLRAELDDYRAEQRALAEKRILMENIVTWADKVGGRLDDVPFEQRRDILKLLLDQVVIDLDNNIRFTLGIPTEEMASIKNSETSSQYGTLRPTRLDKIKNLYAEVPLGAMVYGS